MPSKVRTPPLLSESASQIRVLERLRRRHGSLVRASHILQAVRQVASVRGYEWCLFEYMARCSDVTIAAAVAWVREVGF